MIVDSRLFEIDRLNIYSGYEYFIILSLVQSDSTYEELQHWITDENTGRVAMNEETLVKYIKSLNSKNMIKNINGRYRINEKLGFNRYSYENIFDSEIGRHVYIGLDSLTAMKNKLITQRDFKIYLHIRSRLDEYLGQDDIADDLNISQSHVSESVKKLIENNLISIINIEKVRFKKYRYESAFDKVILNAKQDYNTISVSIENNDIDDDMPF